MNFLFDFDLNFACIRINLIARMCAVTLAKSDFYSMAVIPQG